MCRICLRHLAWNAFIQRRAAAESHVEFRLYNKVFTTHAVYISSLRLQGKPACSQTFCKDLKSDFAIFFYERPQQGEQYQPLEHRGWKNTQSVC